MFINKKNISPSSYTLSCDNVTEKKTRTVCLTEDRLAPSGDKGGNCLFHNVLWNCPNWKDEQSAFYDILTAK